MEKQEKEMVKEKGSYADVTSPKKDAVLDKNALTNARSSKGSMCDLWRKRT